MLFCCCKNLLRPYCFVVLIVTLIFHFYLSIVSGNINYDERWAEIILQVFHCIVVNTTIYAFTGVISKKEIPLLIFLISSVFGFIPIIIDMVLVIADKKIFMFDTTVIEKAYGANAVRPIVCLILMLIFVVKCDLTVVVYQYTRELVMENRTPAGSSSGISSQSASTSQSSLTSS